MSTATAPAKKDTAGSDTYGPLELFGTDRLLDPDERDIAATVRKEFGQLGLMRMHLQGYGCAGTNAVSYGLACLELEAGDNLESVLTYEGTSEMHLLSIGRALTGQAAFR